MDWNKTRQILEKYYRGETTLDEEKQLSRWLQRNDCPADLQSDADLFAFFEKEQQITPSNDTIIDQDVLSIAKERTPSITTWNLLSGIAAAVLLFGFIYLQYFSSPSHACPNGEQVYAVINQKQICDREVAAKEAKEALQFISQAMNEGTKELHHLKKLSTPQHILND